MVIILMVSAKMATLSILKKKAFWNRGYYIINSVNFLSCNSNYVVDGVMWPKFGYSGISMREVIITSIL